MSGMRNISMDADAVLPAARQMKEHTEEVHKRCVKFADETKAVAEESGTEWLKAMSGMLDSMTEIFKEAVDMADGIETEARKIAEEMKEYSEDKSCFGGVN